jgi:predicted transcriptional regulator
MIQDPETGLLIFSSVVESFAKTGDGRFHDKDEAKRMIWDLKFNGLTQTELAKTLGVSAQTVSRWARGQTSPTKEQASQMKDILMGLRANS